MTNAITIRPGRNGYEVVVFKWTDDETGEEVVEILLNHGEGHSMVIAQTRDDEISWVADDLDIERYNREVRNARNF